MEHNRPHFAGRQTKLKNDTAARPGDAADQQAEATIDDRCDGRAKSRLQPPAVGDRLPKGATNFRGMRRSVSTSPRVESIEECGCQSTRQLNLRIMTAHVRESFDPPAADAGGDAERNSKGAR